MKENSWICTDPSCNQFRKDISKTRFLFKENRVVDPLKGKTKVYKSEINLDDYNRNEIVAACIPFGYTGKQVDKWLAEGEEFALMAECIFELEVN